MTLDWQGYIKDKYEAKVCCLYAEHHRMYGAFIDYVVDHPEPIKARLRHYN